MPIFGRLGLPTLHETACGGQTLWVYPGTADLIGATSTHNQITLGDLSTQNGMTSSHPLAEPFDAWTNPNPALNGTGAAGVAALTPPLPPQLIDPTTGSVGCNSQ